MIRRTLGLLALTGALSACSSPFTAPDPTLDPTVDPAPVTATLDVTGEDGAPLTIGADGLVRAEVVLRGALPVRTIGLTLKTQGATLVEWARDDAFLKSNGGQVLQAAGSATIDTLDLVVATTVPVTPGDASRVATVALRPTGDTVDVSIDLTGDGRGVLGARGERLSTTSTVATLHVVGE